MNDTGNTAIIEYLKALQLFDKTSFCNKFSINETGDLSINTRMPKH